MIAGFLESTSREIAQQSRRVSTEKPSPASAQLLSRQDYAMIGEIVEPGSRVLDLGCGEGELLAWLSEHKQVRARGVEIEGEKVRAAVARGVSVYQGDIAEGLVDYPDGAFDFVILSQTLQEMRYPLRVLQQMLRVGRQAIVAFPNFGHWTVRLSHLLTGHSPKTKLFPFDWFESPNLHFLTINDFVALCRAQKWIIERQVCLQANRRVRWLPNLRAEVAVFSIRPST